MVALVIVPCGKSKIWDKKPEVSNVKARDVYTGAPFKVNREYAENFGFDWALVAGNVTRVRNCLGSGVIVPSSPRDPGPSPSEFQRGRCPSLS